MSLSETFDGSDEPESSDNTESDPDKPGSKRAEKVAAAIGLGVGMTGALPLIGMLIAYVFGIERERIKGTGVNKSKIKYAAKEPLYSMAGIAVGYLFNLYIIGEQIAVFTGL